jgi:hypothetical protein
VSHTVQHTVVCLNCGRSEADFPVIVLRLAGHETHICPQCLPALIHHPDRLTEKLIAAGWQSGTPPLEGETGHH